MRYTKTINLTMGQLDSIAIAARKKIRKKYGTLKRSNYSIGRDIKSLRGYCAEVSEEIQRILLTRHKIQSTRKHVKSKSVANHVVVSFRDSFNREIIIDGTITQFDEANKYSYFAADYPMIHLVR